MSDIGWLYRFVTTDTLDEEMCSGDHRWQVAKRVMAEKMNAFEPVEGKRPSFTEDGWKHYDYQFAMERAHCYLFLDMRGGRQNILFRKRGGPVLKFQVDPWIQDDTMTVELSLMIAATPLLKIEKVHPLSRVGDILEMCHFKNHEMKKHYSIYDLPWVHVMSEWGKKIESVSPLHAVWQGQFYKDGNPPQHVWCNCDRSKKNRLT